MSKYQIVIHCDSQQLAVVLPVIEGSAEVMTLEKIADQDTKLSNRKHYVGGKRWKGISSEDLVMEVLTAVKAPVSIATLQGVFAKRGFHSSSAASTASRLARMGKIARPSSAHYCLKNLIVKK